MTPFIMCHQFMQLEGTLVRRVGLHKAPQVDLHTLQPIVLFHLLTLHMESNVFCKNRIFITLRYCTNIFVCSSRDTVNCMWKYIPCFLDGHVIVLD